ncbi:unnamed protein product [Protopolystoma xenopodis]|uniref:Uncharacterized protein n=1 Tax=Protopolystoma xenopodis TaxID=117903 RepID=A0A448WB54_9PLAT|nr:unnamed protein product [Protopolystoma xenopodis]
MPPANLWRIWNGLLPQLDTTRAEAKVIRDGYYIGSLFNQFLTVLSRLKLRYLVWRTRHGDASRAPLTISRSKSAHEIRFTYSSSPR